MGKAIPIVALKNGEFFRKFTSIKEFADWLEENGYAKSAYDGCKAMINNGWVPGEDSQLFGFSAMREDRYKQLQGEA